MDHVDNEVLKVHYSSNKIKNNIKQAHYVTCIIYFFFGITCIYNLLYCLFFFWMSTNYVVNYKNYGL